MLFVERKKGDSTYELETGVKGSRAMSEQKDWDFEIKLERPYPLEIKIRTNGVNKDHAISLVVSYFRDMPWRNFIEKNAIIRPVTYMSSEQMKKFIEEISK